MSTHASTENLLSICICQILGTKRGAKQSQPYPHGGDSFSWKNELQKKIVANQLKPISNKYSLGWTRRHYNDAAAQRLLLPPVCMAAPSAPAATASLTLQLAGHTPWSIYLPGCLEHLSGTLPGCRLQKGNEDGTRPNSQPGGDRGLHVLNSRRRSCGCGGLAPRGW